MGIKQNQHRKQTTEHIQKAEEVELELIKKINGVNNKPINEYKAIFLSWALGVLIAILCLGVIVSVFLNITYIIHAILTLTLYLGLVTLLIRVFLYLCKVCAMIVLVCIAFISYIMKKFKLVCIKNKIV